MSWSRTAAGLLALPGGLALTSLLWGSALRLLRDNSSRGGDPAGAITGLAAAVAALIVGWLTLCLLLTMAAELPGVVGDAAGGLRDRVTPAVVRRWAAVVLGASLGATVVPGTAVAAVRVVDVPADIAAVGSPDWLPTSGTGAAAPAPGWHGVEEHPTSRPQETVPTPGWVPRRPPTRERTDPHLLTGPQPADEKEETVVVRRGDTLWSIAATHLGPEATELEIAHAWPRWYAVNRSVIGGDPALLLPGMQLAPPPAA